MHIMSKCSLWMNADTQTQTCTSTFDRRTIVVALKKIKHNTKKIPARRCWPFVSFDSVSVRECCSSWCCCYKFPFFPPLLTICGVCHPDAGCFASNAIRFFFSFARLYCRCVLNLGKRTRENRNLSYYLTVCYCRCSLYARFHFSWVIFWTWARTVCTL